MKRFIALAVLVLSASTVQATAYSDTTFTYQGELRDNGLPANGFHSMSFRLWDSFANGNQIGPIISTVVEAKSGKFSVELDFGPSAFDHSDRWIQIEVFGNTLFPRQPIHRAPYAIQTRGLFVDANEEVGIGTSNPIAKLQVVGDGNGAAVRITNGSQDDTGLVIGDVFGNARAASIYGLTSSELIKVENEGTGNAAEFYSNDTAVLGNSLTGSGVEGVSSGVGFGKGVYGLALAETGLNYGVLGQSNSSGGYDFFASGAGVNYGSSSSQRWKHNIEPIDDPLEKISQLNGVYFDWDDEHGGHHDIGMIAEEVGAVLPEIVQYEDNGIDAEGMDYSKLTPLLVEAVKHLREEYHKDVDSLRQQFGDEVASLRRESETEIKSLKADLSKLRLIIDELVKAGGEQDDR